MTLTFSLLRRASRWRASTLPTSPAVALVSTGLFLMGRMPVIWYTMAQPTCLPPRQVPPMQLFPDLLPIPLTTSLKSRLIAAMMIIQILPQCLLSKPSVTLVPPTRMRRTSTATQAPPQAVPTTCLLAGTISTPLPIVTEVRLLQLWKACIPILLTLSGISTLVRRLQL